MQSLAEALENSLNTGALMPVQALCAGHMYSFNAEGKAVLLPPEWLAEWQGVTENQAAGPLFCCLERDMRIAINDVLLEDLRVGQGADHAGRLVFLFPFLGLVSIPASAVSCLRPAVGQAMLPPEKIYLDVPGFEGIEASGVMVERLAERRTEPPVPGEVCMALEGGGWLVLDNCVLAQVSSVEGEALSTQGFVEALEQKAGDSGGGTYVPGQWVAMLPEGGSMTIAPHLAHAWWQELLMMTEVSKTELYQHQLDAPENHVKIARGLS